MLFSNPHDIEHFLNHADLDCTIRGATIKSGETELAQFLETVPAAKDVKTFIRVSLARELEFSRIFTKQTHHKGSKDEFEHMTNWSRIFEDLYEKIKWLNDFSMINHIAIFKIIQKFERTFFKFSPNPIALQLKMKVQSMPFRQC